MYECMIKKAFKRHNFITQIFFDRTTELENNPPQTGLGCGLLYSGPKTELKALKNKVEHCSTELKDSCQLIDPSSLEYSNLLLQDKSCPMIY